MFNLGVQRPPRLRVRLADCPRPFALLLPDGPRNFSPEFFKEISIGTLLDHAKASWMPFPGVGARKRVTASQKGWGFEMGIYSSAEIGRDFSSARPAATEAKRNATRCAASIAFIPPMLT